MNQFKIKNKPIAYDANGVGNGSNGNSIDDTPFEPYTGTIISDYFTLNELIKSGYAITHNIDNTPGKVEGKNLQKLVTDILDPIRIKYGKPIIINSGFRNQEVNRGVGGSSTSQHRKGEAADIQTKGDVENGILFKLIERMILDGEITVGQLIWEFGNCEKPDWIHVSLPMPHKKNDLLRAKKDSNDDTYYVAYEEMTRCFRRVLLIPVAGGKKNMRLETLVIADKKGDLAQIQIPGADAARALLKEIKEKAPHADFTCPDKTEEESH
jgi:hypothetical protein